MAASSFVYSLKDVVVTANAKVITGFQNLSNAIEYTPNNSRLTTQISMDGAAVLNISPDKSGVLTLRLLSVHSDNDFFATLLQTLDLGGQAVPIVFQVKKNGGDFVIMGEALPENTSTGALGTEAEERVWRFVGGSWLTFPGSLGNM